ncbi:MAG: GNAT family N-acetyltransferase [Acidiferrobacterales bacterium]
MSKRAPAIRPARAQDAQAISACVAAAYQLYIPRMGKPPGPMRDDYAEVIRQHRVFVLEDGDQVVGVAVLMRKGQGILLDNVAVHPGYQGRGLGRQLIEFAETEAQRQGFSHLDLYTHECMTENIEIYRKCGYIETERRAEQGYQRVYMRKRVS